MNGALSNRNTFNQDHMIFSIPQNSIWQGGSWVYCKMAVCWIDFHYTYVIMSTMASLITGASIIYSTVFSGADKKTTKRHWPLWGEFTANRWISRTQACNAENISIWWRHHEPYLANCVRKHNYAFVSCYSSTLKRIGLAIFIHQCWFYTLRRSQKFIY